MGKIETKKVPDFLIIGAARSGTSSLVEYLRKYNIFLPEKEPNFFFKDSEYKKGIDYYIQKYFNAAKEKNYVLIGEKSSSYLFGGLKTATRIYNFNKNIKLVVILRNPIERAYSNYIFTVRNGIEILDFEYAILKEGERVQHYIGKWKEIKPFDYIGRSKYYSQLKEYYNIFNKENIIVLIFEELINKKEEELQKLCSFLNIKYRKDLLFPKVNSNNVNKKLKKNVYNYILDKLEREILELSFLLKKDLGKIWNIQREK